MHIIYVVCNINQSVPLSRRLNRYRRLLNYVLQVPGNKNANMVKHCSCIIAKYIRKTLKSICQSYILASILKLMM